MKRVLYALLLVLALSTIARAQAPSTVTSGMPLPTSNNQIFKGFYSPATPTITLSNTAVKVGTLVAGATSLRIVAQNGTVNYGSSSVLPDNGATTYLKIASGSSVEIPVSPLTSKPDIYIVAGATGTTPVARLICGK